MCCCADCALSGCHGRCSCCCGSGGGGRDALGLDEVPQESVAADEDRRSIFVGYHLDGVHTELIVPHFNILGLFQHYRHWINLTKKNYDEDSKLKITLKYTFRNILSIIWRFPVEETEIPNWGM